MEKPLDDYDKKILRELVKDARLTNNELAERIGLSKSPCWQRVKRLEYEGYIKGYTSILDQKKLGMSEIVLLEVVLERHDGKMLKEFEKHLAALPEVLEAYLMSGDYDYFIKVAVEGTAEYEKFLREKLYKIPVVRHTRSRFSLGCLKQSFSAVPR